MTSDSGWAVGALSAAVLVVFLWHAWWLDRKHHREGK